MAVRFRKYFPQCKGKRTEGDRYGKVILGGINCNGKRGSYCPDGIPKDCGIWAIEYRESDGRWVSKVFPGANKTQAIALYEEIRSNIRRGLVGLPQTRKIPTVLEYCDKYLKRILGTTKENTYLNKERAVVTIGRHLGDYRLDKLSPFLVESFQANRIKKDGVSSATVNIDLSILRGVLDMAVREGLITINPCTGIKGLKTVSKAEKRSFTIEEIHLLLNQLEGKDRLACLVSLFTGLRLSDVLSLQWSHIDFNNALITRVITKTERQEVIPVSDYLLSALREYRTVSTGNCLFQEGKITHEIRVKYTNHFKHLFRKVGLKGVSFHTLRHSTATLLDTIGNDLTVTSKILGHSSVHITAGFYIHRDLDSKRDAIGRLEEHILQGKAVISKSFISQVV